MDYRRNALSETILTTIVAILVLVMAWGLLAENVSVLIPATAAVGLVVIAFSTIRFTLSPDRVRANQTNRTLKLASKTLEYMRSGLSEETAQAVCKLILPETQGMTVMMTNTKTVLGSYGEPIEGVEVGGPIVTDITRRVIETKEMAVVTNAESISFGHGTGTASNEGILGAVIAPLIVRDACVGTLKIYYKAPHLIDKTQEAIASGLTKLLSTQLSLAELDKQSELATRAELRALQSQINPHFLFNTLNTIASLIRTDSMRARQLLREFSNFYRQTLENSESFITLERELEQTERYMLIETARFGEDRVRMLVQVSDEVLDVSTPSFIIQPIVENSVQHGMPDEGLLTVTVTAYAEGDDVVIEVADDGIGMDAQTLKASSNPRPTSKGTGIALKNVSERLKGFFDSNATLTVSSTPGRGTLVTMRLTRALEDEERE